MEDAMQNQIDEIFNRLHDIANGEGSMMLLAHSASLIIENDRRRIEQIDMVNGANEGRQRSSAEQDAKIKKLENMNEGLRLRAQLDPATAHDDNDFELRYERRRREERDSDEFEMRESIINEMHGRW